MTNTDSDYFCKVDFPGWAAFDRTLLSVCKAPAAPPPSSCFDAEDLVCVSIRDDSQTRDYIIPQKLLAWHSAYFAAATDPNGGFAESGQSLSLECSHKVFEAFYCWMYTGRLKDEPEDDHNTHLPTKVLFDIWIFADFRGIPALVNSAIDMLHEREVMQWWDMPYHAAKYVYKHTREGSNLRAFISDWASITARDALHFRISSKEFETPAEFLHDVYTKISVRGGVARGPSELKTKDRCCWHDHSGPGGKLRLQAKK